METLKNTVKSIICSILIASLSIPIVYAFDGIVGGGGLAQVGRDLKSLIPKKETNTTVNKQENGGNSTIPKQAIPNGTDKPASTHSTSFTHML